MLPITLLLLAADPVVSGVPVGKRPGPYSFLIATGPDRGKQHCMICDQADKPAAVVFARTQSPELAKLLQVLDDTAVKKAETGFKAWATFLTPTADLDAVAKWGQEQKLPKVVLGVFEDADGPPAYRLHREADVTVLLFTKQKVVVNFAFRAKEVDSAAVETKLGKLFE
jgi:hypothetical protein